MRKEEFIESLESFKQTVRDHDFGLARDLAGGIGEFKTKDMDVKSYAETIVAHAEMANWGQAVELADVLLDLLDKSRAKYR